MITASRQPVRLNDLVLDYQTLGPDLRRGSPQDSWWTNFKREMGSLVEVHRSDQPAASADARYNRACSGSSLATSTRPSPKPCGCQAPRGPVPGLKMRDVTLRRTAL